MSRAAVAALAAGSAAAADDSNDADAGPEPGKGGSDASPPSNGAPADTGADKTSDKGDAGDDKGADAKGGDVQQVVAASDVTALMSEAEAKGFAAANARMSTVMASEEGKAKPSTAAFLLANSHANAEAIIAQMKSNPGPATSGVPADSAQIATAALQAYLDEMKGGSGSTEPIANTNVDLGKGVDPKALADEGPDKKAVDDSWDEALADRAAANAPIIPAAHAGNGEGHVTTRALPRTGN